jgi:uncharacterized protein Yka (UPF0111/DUF47 family)
MFNLLPKDQTFYDQLESLGGQVVAGARELRRLMQEFPAEARERANALDAKDKEMETLVQSALERLDAAFITPLDREDILHLITDMHRVVRAIAGLAQRIILYGLDKVDPKLTAQADALARLERCLHELLRQLRKDPRVSALNEPLNQIRQLRRTAEDMQRDFLGLLYSGNPDPLEVMKKKELHDLLVEAVYRSENVARTLERIVLKNG